MPLFKNSAQLLKSLHKKQYFPIYFLQGPETFYIDRISQYITSHILSATEAQLNLRIYYGKDSTLKEVITQARSFPMLGNRQVLLVKEAQEMADLQKVATQKMLSSYASSPNVQTILVFAHRYKSLRNAQLVKRIADIGAVLTTKKLYERELPAWIQQYVQEHNSRIGSKASLVLQTLVGANLHVLASEIDKMLLHLKEGEELTLEHVSKYVGMQKELNVFELLRAIGAKDGEKSFKVVHYLIQNIKKHPLIPMIALFYNFFMKLIQLHTLPPMSTQQLASTLHIPSYFLKDYFVAKKNYSLQQVKKCIGLLFNADLQSKGIDRPTMAEGDILKELTAGFLVA